MSNTHPSKLARPTRAASESPGPFAAVEVTNLAKSYGAVRAVDDLTLRIEPGEIVAVLGPNGAGKSTLNEMILGLAKPDTGSVSVFGLDPLAAVRAGRIGAMLQGGALLADARVIDVLQLMAGLHSRPLAVGEVIERADVGGFLKTKTDRLSGGQAQRLRYALALLPDPDLLILDEPTVGMDVEARRGFWRSMREFADAGRTVMFATHYLEEADDVAHRIIVLSAGRVVAEGTGDQIRSRVAGRTITLLADHLDPEGLGRLPGVVAVVRVGARLHLHTTDSDLTLRALLRDERVHDVEVTAATLEDAFLALTTAPALTTPALTQGTLR
ncbi:ABC transporter ATP-binding protein [Microbacterium sp. 2FI]|uniref:ABC transporter ATP-binding protein n=1 Tax=Microbacterium sp. 2FI TaxID=2502193 RepID=UPI0010F79B7F|nr:ABC transporter ATP-binding protein [Microbacterium sp. 2FI]